jgi:GT2 family glycosyltransferase
MQRQPLVHDLSHNGESARPNNIAVTFIVPVRNDAVRLERCLESLRAAAAAISHEIIVMDHGSTDNSADVARRLGARSVTRETGNVAALRNEGATLSAAPAIAFVDADHQVSGGWLAAALEGLKQPGVGAVGAPYHAPPNGTWVQRTYDGFRRHPTRNESAEWFGAGNLVVRRDAFKAAGGFDVRFESCEDVDLCFRLREAGWRLLCVPAMHSVHHGDPPTLRRLFLSELWRGRDNLRVSMRGPWSRRNLVSMMIPVVQLAAFGTLVLSLATGHSSRVVISLVAAAAIVALVTLKAVWLVWNSRPPNRVGLPAAILVAATFDAGRALALVARAGHHRRAAATSVTTT